MTASQQPELDPSPDVVAQRMGDEIVVVNLRTNRIYDLNRTAARLWELLSAGYTRARISEQLLREFAVDAGQLAQEIDTVLASFQDAKLVRARARD